MVLSARGDLTVSFSTHTVGPHLAPGPNLVPAATVAHTSGEDRQRSNTAALADGDLNG